MRDYYRVYTWQGVVPCSLATRISTASKRGRVQGRSRGVVERETRRTQSAYYQHRRLLSSHHSRRFGRHCVVKCAERGLGKDILCAQDSLRRGFCSADQAQRSALRPCRDNWGGGRGARREGESCVRVSRARQRTMRKGRPRVRLRMRACVRVSSHGKETSRNGETGWWRRKKGVGGCERAAATSIDVI